MVFGDVVLSFPFYPKDVFRLFCYWEVPDFVLNPRCSFLPFVLLSTLVFFLLSLVFCSYLESVP